MDTLRKFTPQMFRSNRTPQGDAERLIGPTTQDDAEERRIQITPPPIRRIIDIMELDRHLLNLIEHATRMLETKSNQNQLKQIVELNKMNVNFLIHEPNYPALQSIGKQKLQDLDELLRRASHTTDQASTSTQHDDPVAKIKEIYDKIEYAKVNVGRPESDQNLIEDIRRLIQEFDEKFQAANPLTSPGSDIDRNRLNNNVVEHIVNVKFVPNLAQSNLILVKQNLEEMNRVLRLLSSNEDELKDKLIMLTRELINQIPKDDSNWEEIMNSGAAIKVESYIMMMDSFDDICNQVAAMHKHSLKKIPPSDERRIDQTYTWCGSFHDDIFNGDYVAVDKFLKGNPLALTTKITVDGNTILHVAVKAEKLTMVQKLLKRLRQQERVEEILKKRNKEGKTALYIAASSGHTAIAKELVEINENILLIECEEGTNHRLPLFVAAKYDKKEMVNYIYKEMSKYKEANQNVECFPVGNPNDKKAKAWMKEWALFLANLIYNGHYDMASQVILDYPQLALYNYYTVVETPLFALAQRPSLGANMTFHDKASTFSCPNGNEMDDGTASKASKLLEDIIYTVKDLTIKELENAHKTTLIAAFFKAAEVGNVGFVAKFIKSHRAVLYWLNDLHQNIFHVAIINRQENIFNLLYGLTGSEKSELTGSADKFNNWMLHLAGEIAPANRLNQVPGPAMQLQRELQWFQAVKEIVPNISIDAKNLANLTPHELFVEKHKNLMKDGETWMRKTASSGSIVATLITTVVFAAGFTVPGGNSPDSGDPLFLGYKSFLLFAVADLVALITSSISVLLFLSILTSRFTEEDFLKSLPIRLFWGLFLLFFSMSAMMFAFCDAIYMIIQEQYNWFCIPIIVVAGFIPIFLFFLVMYPLPFDLLRATTNSIFDKSSRLMYY